MVLLIVLLIILVGFDKKSAKGTLSRELILIRLNAKYQYVGKIFFGAHPD
jgi:hypothetical protein